LTKISQVQCDVACGSSWLSWKPNRNTMDRKNMKWPTFEAQRKGVNRGGIGKSF
jgi:hypothetical protein